MIQPMLHSPITEVSLALICHFIVIAVCTSDGFSDVGYSESNSYTNPRFKSSETDFNSKKKSFVNADGLSNIVIVDSPTNGFWPNSKTTQEFRRLEEDPLQASDNNNSNPGPPASRIFVHHADIQKMEAAIPPPLCSTCSPITWDTYPMTNGTPYSESGPFEPNPIMFDPSVSSTNIPLEVVIRWIHGTGDDQGLATDGQSAEPASELPIFLKDASNDVVRKYFEIVNNPTLTKGDLKNALKNWKLMLPADLLKEYDDIEARKEQIMAIERDRQSKRISSLSTMARQVAEQIEAIRSNDGLTMAEEEYLIGDIMQSIPDDIKAELIAP